MARDRFVPRSHDGPPGVPFDCAEDAWVWYVSCQLARHDGAQLTLGLGEITRPCEPDDILTVVERLYRHGRLHLGHVAALWRLGRQHVRPDERDTADRRAAVLWDDAIDKLGAALRLKGIVA